jgi:hypothetical protein
MQVKNPSSLDSNGSLLLAKSYFGQQPCFIYQCYTSCGAGSCIVKGSGQQLVPKRKKPYKLCSGTGSMITYDI